MRVCEASAEDLPVAPKINTCGDVLKIRREYRKERAHGVARRGKCAEDREGNEPGDQTIFDRSRTAVVFDVSPKVLFHNADFPLIFREYAVRTGRTGAVITCRQARRSKSSGFSSQSKPSRRREIPLQIGQSCWWRSTAGAFDFPL